MTAEAADPAQLQSHRLALRCRLDGRDEGCLAGCSAAAFATRPLAAQVGIVEFDAPMQPLAGIALHHHLGQLVLERPGRGLRHAKAAGEFDAGDALLLWVMWYMARNQGCRGTFVAANMVPAISDVWRRQALH